MAAQTGGDDPKGSAGITPTLLAKLGKVADEQGLLRLSAVSLSHPGFEPARKQLDHFLAEGVHGEMDFMARTQAVRKHPERMLEGAQTLLVALMPYRGEPGPIARYARPADYHTVGYARLHAVGEALSSHLPDCEWTICVDTKPVLERTAAVLAGLGFIGKNGCVIVPGIGSFVLLGELLTTAAWLGPDAAPDPMAKTWQACGSCRLCLDACPTDAFFGPGLLDSRKCISYLTIEHRGAIPPELADRFGERVVGCDVCQDVCPYNSSTRRDDRIADRCWLPPAENDESNAALERLANIRSGRYRALVRNTAMRRIPRQAMRRNALVALGNRGVPLTSEEQDALREAAEDPEPLIQLAAKRALHKRR